MFLMILPGYYISLWYFPSSQTSIKLPKVQCVPYIYLQNKILFHNWIEVWSRAYVWNMGWSKHIKKGTYLKSNQFSFHSVPFKGASFDNLTSNSRPYDYKENPSKFHSLKMAQNRLDSRYIPFVRCFINPCFIIYTRHQIYVTIQSRKIILSSWNWFSYQNIELEEQFLFMTVSFSFIFKHGSSVSNL